MALKAVAPEVVPVGKPKFMISGASGSGKTTFALNFPKPYLIDTEGGATGPQYRKKLIEVGGAYFGKEQGSQDFDAVNAELKALATTKHEYKTLILDSFSALYNFEAARAEEKVGNDFGKDKKEANRPTRQLMQWIEKIDMTIALICHKKDKWARKGGADLAYDGTTFDGYDKLEYFLDLWIETEKRGPVRNFIVKKSRIEAFPEGDRFPLDYSKFSELYGKSVIERPAEAIILATPEQVATVKGLLEVVKVGPEDVAGWLKRANVDGFEEMTNETITKLIAFLSKKLEAVAKR